MHDCTFASHSRWNGLRDWSTPVSALFFFPLFHLSILSSLSVCSNEVNQSASFFHTLFFYLCVFHLVSSSSFPLLLPSSILSLSVLYLCPVMRLTKKPVLVSDPFFLLLRHSPSLLVFKSTASFIFTLYLLFPHLSAPSSFPSLCLCVTGHAVNNKGMQVVAAHQVDPHGTLSLWLAPA